MKICLAQINPTVGDIDNNLKKIKGSIKKAGDGVDLIVFPEMVLSGYPPRDLLHKKQLIFKVNSAVEELIDFSRDYPQLGIIIGAPVETGKKAGKGLYNSGLLISNGSLLFKQHKSLLPTYDVFDETRYFDPAEEIATYLFKGERLGITICEDIWNDPDLWENRHYDLDPVDILVNKGASIIINISASPFQYDKDEIRTNILKNYVNKYEIPFVYLNQVGGNDELIFDGQSMIINKNGEMLGKLKAFADDLLSIELSRDIEQVDRPYTIQKKQDDKIASVEQALVLGIKDYFQKCGFKKAVIGLSGGIDSAVTLCLAAEALGADNILAVSMPGPYSSEGSVIDSRELAGNLGVDFKVISIKDIFESYKNTLSGYFADLPEDVTEENIQARIRGNILMAFSNKFGHLVLATGNKSELAVGYCTLYGDMSGGISVLADVPKTMVYELASYINRKQEMIPEEIIEKAPSAELRPDQKDEDSLPPYAVLDKILYYYIDKNMSIKEIAAQGYDQEMVSWVINRVDNNEYKRRQAAPGLKLTSKAFGMGRRMPVAAQLN
ncbi:NAD+ synthase [Iocasia frigidifontis]|uniref:Glutamine-dependent NAD(+) synthetase n=1 Tax=Iocasia fonsfrigidae TaxID=2682810 RepID=A0A8A7KC77_9FIRM|nr:NAD+ synthase [Iocasia fonsfrigidae]QTL97188.1 NAD+ synthase [Iocasia fonsfrigidae]